MTRTDAKEFLNNIQNCSKVFVHTAVIFYYDQFTRKTAQRNIMSTAFFEVDEWLLKVCKQYKLADFTYVAYLDGKINDSNNGFLGNILYLFKDEEN